MLLSLDEVSDDRRFAQRFACFEPMQPVYQDKAVAIAPNQNWGLLPNFQHTLSDLLHDLRFEQCSALHRHIDVRDLEFFSLHHRPDPPSISLGKQLWPHRMSLTKQKASWRLYVISHLKMDVIETTD
jgi:hypothetical protein